MEHTNINANPALVYVAGPELLSNNIATASDSLEPDSDHDFASIPETYAQCHRYGDSYA